MVTVVLHIRPATEWRKNTLLLLLTHFNPNIGISDYVDSLASYKRNSTRPGSRSNVMSKCRQQVPPDGASSLNPPRSPRFSDRYKHSRENLSGVVGGVTTAVDSTHDWYDPKDAAGSV